MQVIRIEPGGTRDLRLPLQPNTPVRVYVTENFTFPKQARRPNERGRVGSRSEVRGN
jgi:hypothetical protein